MAPPRPREQQMANPKSCTPLPGSRSAARRPETARRGLSARTPAMPPNGAPPRTAGSVGLTHAQRKSYEAEGYLLLPECFSRREVAEMKSELPALFAEESPRRVVEKDGHRVRSVYGSHVTHEVFHRLSRDPRLVQPAQQLLGSEVYVYQFKVNAKAAFGGDLWEWHQDFIFWAKEDGMPAPRAV